MSNLKPDVKPRTKRIIVPVKSIDSIKHVRTENLYTVTGPSKSVDLRPGSGSSDDSTRSTQPLRPKSVVSPEDVEWGSIPFAVSNRTYDSTSSAEGKRIKEIPSKTAVARTRSYDNERIKHSPRSPSLAASAAAKKSTQSTTNNLKNMRPSSATTARQRTGKTGQHAERLSQQPLITPDTADRVETLSSTSTVISPSITHTKTRNIPILTQPMSSSASSSTPIKPPDEESDECRQCGRCRCKCCMTQRQLPESWWCGGRWRCSASSTVDLLSCMCLVKGLFYHCCDDPHDVDPDPNPCNCSFGHRCLSRWASMAALSLILPCMYCYWPLKAGQKSVEACYNSRCCGHRGCKCYK